MESHTLFKSAVWCPVAQCILKIDILLLATIPCLNISKVVRHLLDGKFVNHLWVPN